MKLALGTAQFGLDYGIANRTGKVLDGEIVSILARSRAAGIDCIDTAVLYGDAESRLGRVGIGAFQVVSKLPAVPEDCADVTAWAISMTEASLRRLGIPRLYGLLLHRAEDMAGPRAAEIHGALQAVRSSGLAEKIGISVYDPAELDVAAAFGIDLVQLPFSIVDRRFERSGWLARAASCGIEVHARSVFLQGLLLMAPGERPTWLARWEPLWRGWDAWLAGTKSTPVAACLSFVKGFDAVDRIVVGIDRLAQLEGVLAGFADDGPGVPPDGLASTDPDLINPSRWQIA